MNYAMQRDDYLRQQFRGDINHYHTNTLIFVDELALTGLMLSESLVIV